MFTKMAAQMSDIKWEQLLASMFLTCKVPLFFQAEVETIYSEEYNSAIRWLAVLQQLLEEIQVRLFHLT